MYALKASASSYYDVMSIEKYEVIATIREDRQIEFKETITMRANKNGSVFTRSLPMEKDRYYDIVANCLDSDNFYYYITTDENDYYLQIECETPVEKGESKTYEFSYFMEIGSNDTQDNLLLDIIGYGWGVPLNNVDITVHFPAPVYEKDIAIYSGGYGANGNNAGVTYAFSHDNRSLSMHADKLDVVYNLQFQESMAQGITLQVQFEQGVLASYAKTRALTKEMGKIAVGGIVILILSAVVAIVFRKKPQIVQVVNIKAPDEMDPMSMGKYLDGMLDKEDITSMIYYFAHKGYLSISLQDQQNPVLMKKVEALPATASVHEKTLFTGLFKSGDTVRVEDLKEKFFLAVEIASKQVKPMQMYQKRSLIGYIAGGVIGCLFGVLAPLLISISRIGHGYMYEGGFALAVPIIALLALGYICENYRYKWKKGKIRALTFLKYILLIVCVLIFALAFSGVVMTEYEKAAIAVFAFGSAVLTQGAITREEKYCETLGQILGFKDFIVVTEEEKIKFMLEENPELYYKVLPYAQVLGVTDEWEEKFKNILIQPPHWYSGEWNAFDYLLFNRVMTRSMITAMSRPQSQGNGSFAGRSGGGGHFGGFGGGGHGGGGGGFR